jgi:hypothetical protein
MRRLTAKMIVGSCAILFLVGCQSGGDYSQIWQQQIAAALGPSYSAYQVMSYPTDNFGLITSYDGTPNDANFICDTWDCIHQPVPADPAAELSINGYAGIGNGGAAITLSEEQKNAIVLKALLPSISQVVNAGGSLNAQRITHTELSIGRAYPRKLRRTPMSNFIRGLPTTDQLRHSFDIGNLTVVVADVVIDSIKVTVDVDGSAADSLDAKFDPGAAKLKFIKGADLDVNISSGTKGKYTFAVNKPVVVMFLLKKQPMAGSLGAAADDNWSDWIDVPNAPVPTQASVKSKRPGR